MDTDLILNLVRKLDHARSVNFEAVKDNSGYSIKLRNQISYLSEEQATQLVVELNDAYLPYLCELEKQIKNHLAILAKEE